MIINRLHTDYLQKCYACGRVGHDMYVVNVNGKKYLVCSSDHALELEKEANKEANLGSEES